MIFISVGLIISVLGAYLSRSLLAAEVIYSAALKRACLPFCTRESLARSLFSRMVDEYLDTAVLNYHFFSDYAFLLALELTSAMTLIPIFWLPRIA